MHYNGVQRRGVARLNPNGSLDSTFDPGPSVDNLVRVVAAQPDGKVLIGGDLTVFNTVSRNRLARLNTIGTLDVTFNPGTGANGPVYALPLQPNGKLVIGGSFHLFNTISLSGIGRLLPNGAVDRNFNPGAGANSLGEALALQSDGNVVAGGTFTTFNNTAEGRITRLIGSDPQTVPILSSLAPAAAAFTLTWNSVTNDLYRVDYEAALGGTNWTVLGSNLIATNTTTLFQDAAPDPRPRFYRVVLLPN